VACFKADPVIDPAGQDTNEASEVSLQVRIHGRGGQGAVTAAELLSVSAFNGGMHAQAFPSFGSERTGAPVVAFCRVDDSPIRVREPVSEPDALVIQDPTPAQLLVDAKGDFSQAAIILDKALAHDADDFSVVEHVRILILRAEIALNLDEKAVATSLLQQVSEIILSKEEEVALKESLERATDIREMLS
jgi:2-oxoacid:acceptor oxidoreductase gamma subunit (pyruvate/2-ketoisovalerate family)